MVCGPLPAKVPARLCFAEPGNRASEAVSEPMTIGSPPSRIMPNEKNRGVPAATGRYHGSLSGAGKLGLLKK